MRYIYDTNSLLLYPHLLDLDGEKIVPLIVLRELDKLKIGVGEVAFNARQAVRKLKSKNDIKYDFASDFNYSVNNDDIIIECAKKHQGTLVTGDFLVQIKAEAENIDVYETNDDIDNDLSYGLKEVSLTDEELADFYSDVTTNKYGLLMNEYIVIKDKNDNVLDKLKWNGAEHVKIRWKKLNGRFMGEIRPRNYRQELLFDLLQNQQTTVKACFGKFGVGKDYCMLTHAINLIETNKFEKLVFVRNNIELEDSEPLGFRKGDLFDKLIEFAMPIADHLGGIEGLKMFIDKGQIELQHLGTIRGRDIKNSIIYVTEVQNNTKNHIKLFVGRVGEGSQLWLNGDLMQIDRNSFKYKNGISALSKLAGNRLFGQVILDKTERSETAELAELI